MDENKNTMRIRIAIIISSVAVFLAAISLIASLSVMALPYRLTIGKRP